MSADEHPAAFCLHKKGLHDDLRKAFTLYAGQFWRAVPKDRDEALQRMTRGDAATSDAERRALAAEVRRGAPRWPARSPVDA